MLHIWCCKPAEITRGNENVTTYRITSDSCNHPQCCVQVEKDHLCMDRWLPGWYRINLSNTIQLNRDITMVKEHLSVQAESHMAFNPPGLKPLCVCIYIYKLCYYYRLVKCHTVSYNKFIFWDFSFWPFLFPYFHTIFPTAYCLLQCFKCLCH